MSDIEERLARDIAAITGGVVMTESDLQGARRALDERMDDQRRGRRRVLGAVAAVAAVVVLVAGVAVFQGLGDEDDVQPVDPVPTSTPTEATTDDVPEAVTSDFLQGVWRVNDGTVMARFTGSDQVELDDSGQLLSNPGVQGTYQISGDEITVSVSGGGAGCAGQSFVMRATVQPEPGQVVLAHTQPGTGSCAAEFADVWSLEQVLPMNPDLITLDFAFDGVWEPLTNETSLTGDWMAVGGGYLLELTTSGTYLVADDSAQVIDRGQWASEGTELSLTSAADSVGCAEGDRLVWSDVETINPGTTSIRGTVAENACAGAWSEKAWILLPDSVE